MNLRMIYLYHGDDDYRSVRIDRGSIDNGTSRARNYHPTQASAWRLARLMERILDSKKFWCTSVAPRSLMILFRGYAEPRNIGGWSEPMQQLMDAIGRHPSAEADADVADAINAIDDALKEAS